MEKEYDILQQYRNISGGLKNVIDVGINESASFHEVDLCQLHATQLTKLRLLSSLISKSKLSQDTNQLHENCLRFLKKPNVAEGSEQFGNLAKQLKTQDCPQYAGFCYLAQARCEHTLGNAVAESHLLTEAARSFLQAEQQLFQMNVPSLNEHLNAAINCYSHAIRVHLENGQCPLAANISIELGHALKSLGRTDEAIQHYQRAVELQLQTPLDCLVSLGFITSAKISLNDFEGALATLTEMTYFAHERATTVTNTSCQLTGAFTDILANCEVSRVLLLLLLQPTPQRIRPEHAQILEKYSWENRDESTGSSSQQFLSEELFLLMQSVVMACQTNDLRSLKLLQTDLWPLLSAEQNHLLHLVIAELERPSGQE